MNEKQKLIIDVANECFGKQGFQYTSIGEIVKACKISKSTFYKYFSTKEDLIVEILEYQNKKFINDANTIDNNRKMDEKERMKNKIILIWEYISSNKTFNVFIIERFLEPSRESTTKVKKKIRDTILLEYRKALIEAFGPNVKPILWELIFLLDSLVHEFIFITRIHNQDFQPNFVGNYIMRMIDLSVEKLKEIPVFIDKSIFTNLGDVEDDIPVTTLFFHTLNRINLFIKNNSLINEQKLLEAVEKIAEQVKAEQYNSLIMDAMFLFLENEEAWRKK